VPVEIVLETHSISEDNKRGIATASAPRIQIPPLLPSLRWRRATSID
jgi:hypothetical protein